MTSDNWKETFTFTYSNTNDSFTIKSVSGDGVDLNELGEAFLEFLRGSGFGYVTGVAIETGAETFGSSL